MPDNPTKTVNRSTFPDIKPDFMNRHSRFFKYVLFCLSDFFTIAVSLGAALLFQFSIHRYTIPVMYLELFAFIPLAFGIFFLTGLYSGGLSHIQEVHRLTYASATFFMVLVAISFYLPGSCHDSRFFLLVAWLIGLMLIPLGREIIRGSCAGKPLCSEPVVIIGFGPAGSEVAEYLSDHPQSGLWPVVVVDRRLADRSEPARVPIIRAIDLMQNPEMVDLFKGIYTAILVTDEINQEFLQLVTDEQYLRFRHLLVISKDRSINSLWSRPYEIGEILGLEIGHNLLNTWNQAGKRLCDLAFLILTLPITIPLYLILALFIRIGSPGKVITYRQRMGRHNRYFKKWKFRTLREEADKERRANREPNQETQPYTGIKRIHKEDHLRTSIGRFLYHSGLDNLPQLVNILKGEMSFIGPQAITEDESIHYGDFYPMFSQVLPGITGLWQVASHRDSSYKTRARLDEYYIRNWSIWMDYHILIRTIMVLFERRRKERPV
ncbi:MAG: hypothetical protein GX577_06465 [Leptolinea sp.]|nr:hypothetical protein [Leptolinea sp.]